MTWKRSIVVIGLVLILFAVGLAFRLFNNPFVRNSFWSIGIKKLGDKPVTGISTDDSPTLIPIRVYDGSNMESPCSFIALDGMNAMWEGIGVTKSNWEALQRARMKGEASSLSSSFPELSKLGDVLIDNVIYDPGQTSFLLSEVERARRTTTAPEGLAVLDALEKASKLALQEKKGILISPFG